MSVNSFTGCTKDTIALTGIVIFSFAGDILSVLLFSIKTSKSTIDDGMMVFSTTVCTFTRTEPSFVKKIV